jgi:DNA modification methylase
MTHLIRCKMKPYIQPFERKLALAELAAITGGMPQPEPSNIEPIALDMFQALEMKSLPETEAIYFEVASEISPEVVARKLAYWEYVGEKGKCVTTQVLREATVNVVRNGISLDLIPTLVPFSSTVPLPNRRCLRYGTHGIHEYRGKFFPQLVRSLINIAKVPEDGIIADPMCGSGTTIVESVLAGNHGLGLDLNPLSVLMSRAKCGLLFVEPEVLRNAYQSIRDCLLQTPPATSSMLPYFSELLPENQKYLREWFSEQVLRELDLISMTIRSLENGPIRDLMILSLSNIIRRVSWQKDADLRVRKEIRVDADIDPIKEFLEELGSSIRTILAFLYQNRGSKLGLFDIREGDARTMNIPWREYVGKVDAVITSPPYATALPYLDTDRLSLYYLGLLSRPQHRKRDQDMIGNREIADKSRQIYWDLFQEQKHNLPESAVQLIENIYRLNSSMEVGFRRQNLPSLLAKYFLDMRDVLAGIKQLLKPGAYAYVVVGNNHTIAGGERVEIETANILGDIAADVGLEHGEHISMEMLVSREIYRSNAVASEVILSFRRPILS